MIIDLHNDLLSYLRELPETHTPFDNETRSSVGQYRVSDVQAVVYVAFVPSDQKEGHLELERQGELFIQLPEKYPEAFSKQFPSEGKAIAPFFAIENCAAFAREEEPIDQVLQRFTTVTRSLGLYPVYASLTWNGPNRFGVGSFSSEDEARRGLTEDGRRLVDTLHNAVTAFDVSHASDRLAYDLFEYLEKKGYATRVIASHSNFRAVCPSPRNVPDDIAVAIARRGGVIGLNCIKPFLGDTIDSIFRHVEHGLKLVGEDALALGADFFSLKSIPEGQRSRFESHFFDELPSADHLKSLFSNLSRQFSEAAITKMAATNAMEKLIKPHQERVLS